MGSGAVIYVPSLINIGSGIQNREQRDQISLLYFFQNKKSRLQRIHTFGSAMSQVPGQK
jgi:hypothetical protein